MNKYFIKYYIIVFALLVLFFSSIIIMFKCKIEKYISTNANIENDLISYINRIDNVVLCIYEMDISGEVLTLAQKDYITSMYINYYKGVYIDNIVTENDFEYISKDVFKQIYGTIFDLNEFNDSLYQDNIRLHPFNMNKVYLDKNKILSCKYDGIKYIVDVEYTSVFENNSTVFKVTYYIRETNISNYSLVGFVIKG